MYIFALLLLQVVWRLVFYFLVEIAEFCGIRLILLLLLLVEIHSVASLETRLWLYSLCHSQPTKNQLLFSRSSFGSYFKDRPKDHLLSALPSISRLHFRCPHSPCLLSTVLPVTTRRILLLLLQSPMASAPRRRNKFARSTRRRTIPTTSLFVLPPSGLVVLVIMMLWWLPWNKMSLPSLRLPSIPTDPIRQSLVALGICS